MKGREGEEEEDDGAHDPTELQGRAEWHPRTSPLPFHVTRASPIVAGESSIFLPLQFSFLPIFFFFALVLFAMAYSILYRRLSGMRSRNMEENPVPLYYAGCSAFVFGSFLWLSTLFRRPWPSPLHWHSATAPSQLTRGRRRRLFLLLHKYIFFFFFRLLPLLKGGSASW